jgi:hypothetical protein
MKLRETNIGKTVTAIVTAAYFTFAPGCASIKPALIIDDVSGPDCYLNADKKEICPEDERKNIEKEAHALIGRKALEGQLQGPTHGQAVIIEHEPHDVTINSKSQTEWESRCTTHPGARHCDGSEDYKAETRVQHTSPVTRGYTEKDSYHGSAGETRTQKLPDNLPTEYPQPPALDTPRLDTNPRSPRTLDNRFDSSFNTFNTDLDDCKTERDMGMFSCKAEYLSLKRDMKLYKMCKAEVETTFKICMDIVKQQPNTYAE